MACITISFMELLIFNEMSKQHHLLPYLSQNAFWGDTFEEGKTVHADCMYLKFPCVPHYMIIFDCMIHYTGGILQWLDTDVHSAVTAKTSTAL